MIRRVRSPEIVAVAALLAAVPWAPALAQTPLPMGSVADGQAVGDEPAEYSVEVAEAGFLTVVVRSQGGEDVRVLVADDEHQVLPDGRADVDLRGDVGAEQIVVLLPRPGAYRVLVESWDPSGASFRVGAGFIAAPGMAAPPDPDGKPSGATELAPGADHEDTLDPAAGDALDWYRVTAGETGTLTVLTRADEGDLLLELFVGGDFREPAETSDQDQGGVMGNESITVDVEAGQVVHFRVGPSVGPAGRVAYRIASGLIPGGAGPR